MQSFEFQVVVNSPLEKVFALYTDIEWWRNRSIFADIRWTHGEPWTEGSRLRIESRKPIRASVDQVLLEFRPRESVVYISHVLGMTCETRIKFAAASAAQTVIQVRMQLLGTVSRVLGFAIEPVIEKSTREFFEDLRRESEDAARRAASGGG